MSPEKQTDGSYTITVPKPPPCLPDPNSLDDLFTRMHQLPYGFSFEALHGSHQTYDWIAIIGYRYGGEGHGDPGETKAAYVGVGRFPEIAIRSAVEQAEAAAKVIKEAREHA